MAFLGIWGFVDVSLCLGSFSGSFGILRAFFGVVVGVDRVFEVGFYDSFKNFWGVWDYLGNGST